MLKRWSRTWSYFTQISTLQPSSCCIVLHWSTLYCSRELRPCSSGGGRQRSSRREPQGRINRGCKSSSRQSEGSPDSPHCIACITLTTLHSLLHFTVLYYTASNVLPFTALYYTYCTVLYCVLYCFLCIMLVQL